MGEYTRRVDIQVKIDLWDWAKGASTQTLDVTNDLLNYRFQKTIKTPKGSCQIAILPQSSDTHILDIISPMDVVRIFEFGALKFIGYIQRISYTGSIGKDGKPQRSATLTVVQFGGILVDASIGLGFGSAMGRPDEVLRSSAVDLMLAIDRAVEDGVSYAELITILLDNFKTYLTALGGKNFLTYLEKYLDVGTGLTSNKASSLPRSFELYTGTEQSLTFWQVAEQLIEKPFNEFWIDNGPRTVNVDGKSVTLPSKSCFVFRETPFDGTVNGISTQTFTNIKAIHIDKDHFIRFDLARSMDEVYSVYDVKQAAYQLDDVTRILLGEWEIDEKRIGKYLFKPLITELFYIRMEKTKKTEAEIQEGKLSTASKNAAKTLKAWFENNDEYLSGVVTMMVPSDNSLDPKIGDKITVYGIDGFFYVEAIAHTWAYQGALKSDLTITRGYNRNKRIELKDKIFKRTVM